jgi:histidine triad (HIT) family protein
MPNAGDGPGDCIFCKIAAGEVPAQIVRDDDGVIAFRDLNPQAPTHVLVISRDHHPDVVALAAAAPQTLAAMVRIGAELAAAEADGQFRLVFNTGANAGQSVFHVHGHILGGRALHWPPG